MADILNKTLKSLGFPVKRIVYKLKKGESLPDTYITFQRIVSTPDGYADDESTFENHTFGVHLFTRGDFTELLKQAKAAVKAAGFTISSVDTEIYETDTGLYHVPMIIKWMEE
jgi:hypothetical protein